VSGHPLAVEGSNEVCLVTCDGALIGGERTTSDVSSFTANHDEMLMIERRQLTA